MTTAIVGTGGLGSVIARQLASGGEAQRLSSADTESARTLAAKIGRAAVVAADNERLIRTAGFELVKVGGVGQSNRLEVGGDLHDLVVGPAEARSLVGGT
jgi:predicted dinucleotide-binding enzyme